MPDSVDLEKFRRAAAAGHPVGQFNLGLWHLRQAPRGSVPPEAQELILAAAKQDFVPAQTLIGKLLFKLEGAEQRPLHARHWFERAAAAGNAEAQYRLGELLAMGLTGEPDAALALEWLMRSADHGHAAAQMQVAYCLEHGIGVSHDAQAATQLCFKAAHKGDARAQNLIGRRYASGHTLPQDAQKALAWHLRAAAQDYPGAAAEVARLSAALDESAVHAAQALAKSEIPEDTPERAAPVGEPSIVPQILSEQPRVRVCKDFMTPEECDHLIAIGTPFLMPSKVITKTGLHEQADARTSQEMALQDQIKDLVVWNVEQRLARFAALPVQHGEPLMILHYGRGDEYRPHVDYFDPRVSGNAPQLARAGQRLVTVLTYLCDVEGGGGTRFPKIDLLVAPEKGKALLFHNCKDDGSIEPLTQHAGEPVLAGEKWLATRWIREWDWRLTRAT
ncbi:MAG: SEL1-like repeat protein [Gammaproteobacteria bacterium]|nr:SEL1-like repeat protein [Gammaproteobacteria bacterium]